MKSKWGEHFILCLLGILLLQLFLNENGIKSFRESSNKLETSTISGSQNEKRVIVTFKDQNKSTLKKETVKHHLKHLRSLSVKMTGEEIDKLRENTDVESIELDQRVQAAARVVDWGTVAVEAPSVSKSVYTGTDVKIAVIDSGIDTHHEDLVVSGGISLVEGVSSYDDEYGHGTYVAGIIGAKNNDKGIVGVAPDASLYAVRVLDSEGVGYLSDIIAGIDWAINNKMNIINISLVTSVDSNALHEAVDRAYQNGIVVVASAGNDGNMEGTGDTVQFPGHYSSVIAVGAVDSKNERASYSATGNSLEIVAPGVGISSTYIGDTYGTFSGTSVAAPFVTGVLAQMKQQNPSLSPTQLRALLARNASDLDVPGRDPLSGYGLLQFTSSPQNVEDTQDYIDTGSDGYSSVDNDDTNTQVKPAVQPWQVGVTGTSPDGRVYGVSWSENTLQLQVGTNISGAQPTVYSALTLNIVQSPYAITGLVSASWKGNDLRVTYSMNGCCGQPIKDYINPVAPTNVSPGSLTEPKIISGAVTTNFVWNYIVAPQTAFQIKITKDGAQVFDSAWVTSSVTSYSVPSGILVHGNMYAWSVAIKDSAGKISPLSTPYNIKVNAPPVTSITSYVDNQQLTSNTLTFTWSYSDLNYGYQNQSAFQIVGSKDNWKTIGYDSGIKNGREQSLQMGPLANGIWKFKLVASDGLEWSNPVYRTVELPNSFEPNDTIYQSFPIMYTTTYDSTINSSTDIDYYKYKATTGGNDMITLNVPSGVNYDIYVYDTNMNLQTSGTKGIGSNERVFFSVKAGSDYWIKIVGTNGNFSTSTYSFYLESFKQNKINVYDSRGRLDYIIITDSLKLDYEYDNNGNLLRKVIMPLN